MTEETLDFDTDAFVEMCASVDVSLQVAGALHNANNHVRAAVLLEVLGQTIGSSLLEDATPEKVCDDLREDLIKIIQKYKEIEKEQKKND